VTTTDDTTASRSSTAAAVPAQTSVQTNTSTHGS
jgi:hypothetical protein